jgi:hypothetical protein
MNAEELLEHKREIDRQRQAKFYENKKDEINERKRIAYQARKDEINAQRQLKYAEKKANEEPSDIIVSKNGKALNLVSADNVNMKFINYLQHANYSEHTKLRYVGDMKRIIQLIGERELLPLIKSGELQILIQNSTYSKSTQLGMATTILTALTGLKIKLTKRVYANYQNFVELLKQHVNNELVDKQDTEIVMKFGDYINQIKTKFGETSKIYLIALLYNELTLRDDFQLQIVDKLPKVLEHNYIVLNNTRLRVVITKYKTEKKYGVISELLSQSLSTKLKKYIHTTGLVVGDYLFGNEPLSNFILYNNKQIGVNGGVSLFRHMKITELSNDANISQEDMIKLASKMKHSPLIQLQYLRNLADE